MTTLFNDTLRNYFIEETGAILLQKITSEQHRSFDNVAKKKFFYHYSIDFKN